MIFFETGHTLRLGSNGTEMNLRVFQGCASAQFIPILLDDILIKLGYFTDGDLNSFDTLRLFMLDDLIENCFCGSLFTHRFDKLYDMRPILNR